MANITNGFKDADQSIVSYAIAEAQRKFVDLAHPTEGALYLLKGYREQYGAAGLLAAMGGAIGIGGCIAAMGALSLPALSGTFISGAIVAMLGGTTALRQFEGKGFCAKETAFLKRYPALLSSVAAMEAQGVPPLVLVSAYDETLELYSKSRPLTAQELHLRFCDSINAALLVYQTAEQGIKAFQSGELIELEDLTTADSLELPEAEGEAFEPEAPYSYEASLPQFFRDKVAVATVAAPKMMGVPATIGSPASTPTAILAPDRPGLLSRIISIGGFLPSRLFVGASRSGKSQVASDAGALARQKYPNATIFYISAGYKPEEDDNYWRFANHVAGYAFKDMTPEQRRSAYEHWLKILDEFHGCAYSRENPKLLIADELDTIMTFAGDSESGKLVAKNLTDKLTFAGSVGAKDGFVVWAIAPVGDMGSLGLTRGKSSAFNPVYVARFGSGWNSATYKTAAPNGLAPRNLPTGFRDDDRIVGIGGEWELLPQTQQLALNGPDCRILPASGVDMVMAAVVAQTLAQINEPEPASQIVSQMRAIYEYAQRRDVPVNKRGIRQATLPALDGMDTDDIGTLLELMAEDGFLHFQDDVYTVNPNKKP
jgi:hypothetical protein